MTDHKKNGPTTPGQEEEKKYPEPTTSQAYFFNILKHQKTKMDVDWDAVATDSGFKNADVAKVRFGQIKRKLGLDAGAATKTPTKGSAKKAGKPATPGDDTLGPNTAGAKVEKKPRKRTSVKAKAQVPENGDMDDTSETATSPSTIVKTEDTPIKLEEEHELLPFTPTPRGSFRAHGYHVSPLNYTEYSFNPGDDDGHDI